MKGQLFSLDALLALVAITIALALLINQTEIIYNSQSSELQGIATDFSQIAVKKALLDNWSEANLINATKMNLLKTQLDNVLSTNYNYKVSLFQKNTLINSIQSIQGCSAAQEVAIIKKPVFVKTATSAEEGHLIIEVCK